MVLKEPAGETRGLRRRSGRGGPRGTDRPLARRRPVLVTVTATVYGSGNGDAPYLGQWHAVHDGRGGTDSGTPYMTVWNSTDSGVTRVPARVGAGGV
ncbi:hypothetical protein ACFQ08_20545 [Streptosporangium algeriense]|uniref:Uncharacterized protein n=1 Tax=Streptosporangium algeriense TaxID=1682748 RepID=A0ABW3DW30_9ACTN